MPAFGLVAFNSDIVESQKTALNNGSDITPHYSLSKGKGKGKAVPLQAWSGPEGSRKLRFPDFMTMAQDGGKVVSLMHQPPLPPGNTPGTHSC
jgi:hypothetical protein